MVFVGVFSVGFTVTIFWVLLGIVKGLTVVGFDCFSCGIFLAFLGFFSSICSEIFGRVVGLFLVGV